MTQAAWRRMRRAEAQIAGKHGTVAGVDEAGRGPLAGPVVAAAVVLPAEGDWEGLNDSKLLDAETREQLFALVHERALARAWAVCGPRTIERRNIRNASLAAMRRSVERLRVRPDIVLVDGADRIPGLEHEQRAEIDGDARLLSIAAASVIAKVVRDRFMVRADQRWPEYGFAKHKGYATPEHLAAIDRYGPCLLHRFSFSPVAVQELPFGEPAATG